MAKNKTITITKLDKIRAMKQATAPGIFPGMGRARTFKDRKKHANKKACRGKVQW